MEQIFARKPFRWGLRGDPFLWDDLQIYFSECRELKSEREFVSEFHIAFRVLAGQELKPNQQIYINKYCKGGMSSGMVSSNFWIEMALPLLIKRFNEIRE